MRPLYETPADLRRESELISKIEPMWKCKFRKMPIQYKLDFAVERNDSVVAFCEVKVRKYSMEDIDSMGGYKISLAKWMAGMQMLKETGHPFVILVGATDGIFQKTVKHPPKLPLNIAVWGRDDRGDNQDFEPCVIIDAKEFKQI